MACALDPFDFTELQGVPVAGWASLGPILCYMYGMANIATALDLIPRSEKVRAMHPATGLKFDGIMLSEVERVLRTYVEPKLSPLGTDEQRLQATLSGCDQWQVVPFPYCQCAKKTKAQREYELDKKSKQTKPDYWRNKRARDRRYRARCKVKKEMEQQILSGDCCGWEMAP